MSAIFVECADILRPQMKYQSIRDLVPISQLTFTEYPEPITIFVRFLDFAPAKPHPALKKLPRGITRPNTEFVFDPNETDALKPFRPYIHIDLSHPMSLAVIAAEAAPHSEMLLGFKTIPAGLDTRELCLLQIPTRKGLMPIIWNARHPDAELGRRSFIPHADLYCSRGYLGQAIRSPGSYIAWGHTTLR